MGRQNLAYLYGRVSKKPVISINKSTGEYNYGMCYIDTVRGLRSVGDDIHHQKHARPLIMSRSKEILDNMIEWQENDIVLIKGPITSRTMMKKSVCDKCSTTDKPTINENKGNLVFVTPIYVEKIKSYDNKKAADEDVIQNSEISNQCFVIGTLIRDPKLFTTKTGLKIAQYPIAINRKFIIRTDDPSIRTDWPVVKSYGEQAVEDKMFLKFKADIMVDGYLQTRTVIRRSKCPHCGEYYEWKDRAMELVPYEVEYVAGMRSKEDVERENGQKIEQIRQQLFTAGAVDDLSRDDPFDQNLVTDDIRTEETGVSKASN